MGWTPSSPWIERVGHAYRHYGRNEKIKAMLREPSRTVIPRRSRENFGVVEVT
jgi:hypothetical protein